MKFFVAAIFAAVASNVYAQTAAVPNAGVALAHPGYGDVIYTGTTYTITWVVDTANTNPSTSINSIALKKGGSANLDTVIPNILSAAIPVNPPSYSWVVPTTIETATSYVLTFVGSNGQDTYSTYFTIIGAAPGTSNITTVAASSGAPVASVASGAPASGKPSSSVNSSSAAASVSAASGIKAGIVGVAGVAVGAVALLL